MVVLGLPPGAAAVQTPRRVAKPALRKSGRQAARTRHCKVDAEVDVSDTVLGEGICGSVMLGHSCGRSRAVKRLDKSRLRPSQLSRVRQEIALHFELDHPHVVALDSVYETEFELTLVTELLAGGDLFDHVASRGRMEERAAAEVLRQVLRALAYLHSKGVVHCDLKPENVVFLDQDKDFVKLVDFGSAQRFSGKRLRSPQGTFQYAAPESFDGIFTSGSFTQKADLWALGVLTYMLLCGREPWPTDEAEADGAIREGRPSLHPRLWRSLTAEARSFVSDLLKAEHTRPGALEALTHPWLSASSQPTVLSLPLDRVEAFVRAAPHSRACALLSTWSAHGSKEDLLRFIMLSDDKGTISRQRFQQLCEAWNEAETQRVFNLIDQNGDGEVSLCEFLALFRDEPAKDAFSIFDSGCAAHRDIEQALQSTLTGLLTESKQMESKQTFPEFQLLLAERESMKVIATAGEH